MQNKKNTICFIVNSSYEIDNFVFTYITELAKENKVLLVSNDMSQKLSMPNISYKLMKFERNPSPIKDFVALLKLYNFLRKEDIQVIYSINPKTGLLATLAGFLARVKKRVHIVTGQVWITRKGLWRKFLKFLDVLIGKFATHLIVDSESQRDFLVSEAVIKFDKATVLASGSVCGVNVERFSRNLESRQQVREKYAYKNDDKVILFLGRITKDKGVFDLFDAYEIFRKRTAIGNTKLLFVGPDEGAVDALQEMKSKSKYSDSIQFLPSTKTPEIFYSAADVFCLPSYREGFGQVILEAAASKLPSIGSRIYGLTDAIIDGETGALFEAGNVNDLADKLESLLSDSNKIVTLGENAYSRVVNNFKTEVLTNAFAEYHRNLVLGK